MVAARVSPAAAFSVACLGIASFACMDAVMKGQAIVVGAYNALLWRSVGAVAISGVLFVARRSAWPDRGMLILHGKRSLASGVSVLLFFWGLVRVPLAEGVALTFLAPVFAILLAAPMLGERIGRSAFGACALAFAGMVVIVAGRARDPAGGEAMQGALAIVVASAFYAYNLVLLRRTALRSGPIEITFFTNLVFVGFYGLAAPVLAVVPAAARWPAFLGAAALVVVSSLLLAWAYAHAEAQRLAPVEFTGFVWAAILGALVFGERVVPATLAGAGLIVAGCIVAARGRALPGPVSEAAA